MIAPGCLLVGLSRAAGYVYWIGVVAKLVARAPQLAVRTYTCSWKSWADDAWIAAVHHAALQFRRWFVYCSCAILVCAVSSPFVFKRSSSNSIILDTWRRIGGCV
jgi:hypothetical protein